MPINLSPFAVLLAASALAGCKEEENHTVAHYLAHPEARTEMLETCEISDRALQEANCVNAAEAALQEQRQKDREGFRRIYGEPVFV